MKYTMKKLLAALVACMLLLSSVAAMAGTPGETPVKTSLDDIAVEQPKIGLDATENDNKSDTSVEGTQYGVKAEGGHTATVNGDTKAGSWLESKGVYAKDEKTIVEVKGNVTSDNYGVYAEDGAQVTVGTVAKKDDENVGNVTSNYAGVTANGENTLVNVYGNVKSAGSTGAEASGHGEIHVTGNVEGTTGVSVNAGKVTVDGSVKGTEYNGVYTSTSGVVNVAGNVEGNNDGVNALGGEINIGGNVTGKNGDGIDAGNNPSRIDVKGNVEGGKNGVTVSREGSEITVGGSVKGAERGVQASFACTVTVMGNVSSDSNTGVDAEYGSTVIVDGDVNGGNAGVFADGGSNVIVNGTITGKKDGVHIGVEGLEDDAPLSNSTVTAWKIESEGKIITAGNAEKDERLKDDLIKAINYIIRVAEKDNDLNLDKTEGKREVGGYQTAREGEEVISTLIGFDEGDTLDEVYYNETTKLDASQYKLQGNSLIVTMLRGGAMNLLAKIHRHTEATREENKVAATCTQAGSYDLVTYCSVCNKVLSTEKKTVAALGHTPAAAVKENEVAAKPGVAGSYDEVVYCSVCKAEISRKKVEIPALPTEEVKPAEETKTEETATETKTEAKTETKAATRTEFVYVPVNDNTAVNGVKAADHADMGETFKTVGDSLDGEGASVDIVDKEKLMDAAELARFDKLSVKDRLLVVLKALGFGEALGEIAEDMSDDAVALSDDIAARVDAMTESERNALLNRLYGEFLPRLIVIDEQEYEAVGIEVVIDRNGQKTYERYTFYKDGGAWKLYQIEQGEYRTVEA